MNIFDKLQNIDRRIIYLLVVAVIAVPLIAKPKKHPTVILPEVRNAYATLDRVPKDKIVLISSIWGPGTEPENAPQTTAIMRHLFQKNIRFAVVSWDQPGTELTYQIGKSLEKELGKKYGVDWAHFGFKILDKPPLLGISRDFRKIMSKDIDGTPIDKLSAMDGVKNASNLGAVVEITPSGTLEFVMAYLTGSKIPLVYCPTAVMSVEAYKYLDSGQVKGMLNSAVGAAQYETLIGQGNKATDASITTWALSAVHIYILILILLGNVGYMVTRRRSTIDGGASDE
ncbi:MAG: hypothetical protein NT018_10365 [Armatimonadetes bacterium]|nr:hypothetical protein [Armatimonadota bacterium]